MNDTGEKRTNYTDDHGYSWTPLYLTIDDALIDENAIDKIEV
jgi:hypothetical protein